PTQIAKKTAHHTPLPSEESGKAPETQHKLPKLSMDDEEVVEAEAAESDIVEAQPASDVTEAEAIEASSAADEDIFDAEAAEIEEESPSHSAPKTPVKAEYADDAL